jgi:hypothetical protein
MTNRSESTRSRAQDAAAGQPRNGVGRRERRLARFQGVCRQRVRGQTPDPHPSAPSAGTVYLNSRDSRKQTLSSAGRKFRGFW